MTLALCAAFSTQANSATPEATPALKSALADNGLLTDITIAGDTIVAVGERGHVIYSEDGTNWQQANVPVNVLLTSVSFKNESLGFATGHDATLLRTKDAGRNWEIVNYQPELDKPLLSVGVSGDNAVAVGAYGLYWQSNDAGNTWTASFHDELLIEDDRLFLEEIKEYEPENYESEKQFLLPHFNNVLVGEDTWYMVGEAGFYATSSNQGEDWEIKETEYFGSYFSIGGNSEQLMLAGLRGNAFLTDVSLQQWQPLPVPVPATINSMTQQDGVTYLFANSGNVFTVSGNQVSQKLFADGKAVMAGVVFKQRLILATEAGIKSVELSDLPK